MDDLITLHCTADTDTDARTIAGRLVPFNEVGNTSIGPTKFTPDSIRLDAAAISNVPLNLEHDATAPIGRAALIETAEDGVYATFTMLETARARDALLEAAPGPNGEPPLRGGLSVECRITAKRHSGDYTEILGAEITGAALTVAPAFATAGVETISATQQEQEQSIMDETLDAIEDSAPEIVSAGRTVTPQRDMTLEDVTKLLYATGSTNAPDLIASLDDITYQSVGADIAPPAWVGELWSGVAYQRRFWPLLGPARTLRSLKIAGWRWTVAPQGGTYAGNKTAIPTNTPETEAQETEVMRWAGGHDFDRALVDFPSVEFWRSYFERMTADYAAWTDSIAAQFLATNGTDGGTAPDGVRAIVEACFGVLDGGGIPNAVALAPDVFREFFDSETKLPEWITGSVSLSGMSGDAAGVRFAPVMGMDPGTVVALDTRACTAYELGSVPIRVEQPHVARGGVDVGMFGYAGIDIHLESAIVTVSVDSA